VMNMFHIPDVDLLEQIHDSATVRLAPNDAESATITFDTGVAQRSITSPQLFNIFINALLWMLMATNAWHVPWSVANSLYTFPTAEGGHECPAVRSTHAGLAAAR